MAVTYSRAGRTVTVSVTVDAQDLRLADYTPAQQRELVARAALEQLAAASESAARSDAEIDAEFDRQVSEINALRAARKAAKPTGNL